MELWIRNQDKTLLSKVDRIVLEDFDNCKPKIYSNNDFLGEYETKERALEILDEIQNGLLANFNFNGSYEEVDLKIKTKMINGLYGVIYEMPKD